MLFKNSRWYDIIQTYPHLWVETEEIGTIAMPDTGYNGVRERIPRSEVEGNAKKFRRHVWLGSLYFAKIGSILNIDMERMKFCISNKVALTGKLNKIKMTKSGYLCGPILCPDGDLVTIPIYINSIKANAFVDTGAMMSSVLRARLNKLNLERPDCTSPGEHILVQGQTIRLDTTTNVYMCLNKNNSLICVEASIACGKNDKFPSRDTNKILENIDLDPKLDCVLGNDLLTKLRAYAFDYNSRIMYYSNHYTTP